MSSPVYSAAIIEIYSRAAVFSLGPMQCDPALDEFTMPDIGLQLILEGLSNYNLFPASGPGAAELAELRRLWLDHENKAYHQAFCAAARHLIYNVESVVEMGVVPPEHAWASQATYHDDVEPGAWGNEATVTVIGRFPWLFSYLSRKSFWESYICNYTNYVW